MQSEAIEVVVYRLRKKLARTGAQLVTLRGLGYLLQGGGRERGMRRAVAAQPAAARHPAAGAGAVVAINTVSLYRQALRAADTAYDRTLLASAKSIGEQLEVTRHDDAGAAARHRALLGARSLRGRQPQPHVLPGHRLRRRDGLGLRRPAALARHAAGQAALRGAGRLLRRPTSAAQPVRVAVLLQPVASADGRGMADDPGGRDAGAARRRWRARS